MSTAQLDLWGQDIALDEHGQARVAANGELVLTDGVDTGVQDIQLRLFTRLGSLFYDTTFGSLIHDWINEESTPENRAAFVNEIIMRVEADPRVTPFTVKAAVLQWNATQLVASVRWHFIEDDHPYNLVMQLNKNTKELIVSDAKPDTTSFSTAIS